MKKSISTWSFHGQWNLREKLQLAKDAGFAGFEIDLTRDGPLRLDSDDHEIRQLREAADAIGITFSGVASGLYWECNPASADPAIRGEARKILRAQIRAASLLGVDTILVIPGSVGVDFIPGAEIVPYEAVYERATAFVREALPEAEDRGVTLGIENVWNKFLLSPLEFRAFLDQFGSSSVGAYFDVGNTLATGYPEHWIATLGARIRRVHFKDYRRAVGSVDGFVDLLSGNVNWPAVIAGLRATGYDSWVAAEMIPPVPFYQYCPEALITNTSRAMDHILTLA